MDLEFQTERGEKETSAHLKKHFFDLPARSDLHLKRKLWHVVTGTMMAFGYQLIGNRTEVASLFFVLFVFSISMELMRLRFPNVNRRVMVLFKHVMRSHETRSVSGMPYYIGAVAIAVALFPPPVAVLSILYLAWGDPISSLSGILWGKDKIFQDKSLVGTMAGFLICSLITFLYLGSTGILPGRVLLISLLGGIVAAVTEILPFNIDDNASIPLISGFFLWLLFLASGYPPGF